MNDSRTKTYAPNETKCEVCADPLTYGEFLEQQNQLSLVCRSHDCRQILRWKETNPFLFRQQLESHRRVHATRRQNAEEKRAFIERVLKRESSENRLILQSVLETSSGHSKQPPHVVSIPTGLSTPHRLSEDRLAAYKAHLEAIIDKCFSEEPVEAAGNPVENDYEKESICTGESHQSPQLTAIREQLCGICKGGCCAKGGNTAFLTESTIGRICLANPHLSAKDILHEYTSRISDQTMENSCVNQTRTGCALPRELRSDTCNNFYCRDLLKLQDQLVDESNATVLAIKRSFQDWNRIDGFFENRITEIALVKEDSIELIDIELAEIQ